jgi:energy-coupling factor transporter ATP-binding protein EcfA2
MKLDRLIFVNWGQLPSGSYDLGNLTLLTGETGSGKSTMLDGLQTVMTAGFKGITQYNSGQDEVGQGGRGKSRRDLESYIVGAEYSKFSRPLGAHGYVAAVFQPDAGEEQCKPMTAVVAASAHLEGLGESRQARLESFALYIADGAELVLEDFMPDVEAGQPVPLESIGRQLRAKYKVTEFHDKKSDYLCALYGRFRGKPSVPRDEAHMAARAWVQSIAYRKIGSVHELVRDEILDFDSRQLHQDIERISSLMKEVANLRKEGERLQGNVERLDALLALLHLTGAAHENHVVQELFAARLRLETEKGDERRHQLRIETNEGDKRRRTALIDDRKTRKDTLDTERTNLMARMQGIPAQQQKDQLDGRIKAASHGARRVLRDLSESLMAASLMDTKTQALLATPQSTGMDRVNQALEAVAEAYRHANIAPLRDASTRVFPMTTSEEQLEAADLREVALAFDAAADTGLQALFNALAAPQDSLQVAITQQSVLQESVRTEAEKRVRELQARKATLASGRVEYPKGVTFALRRLQEQFPSANAQVLCDLIEPKSEEWQPAIEGYLGNARFNIIVSPAWETRVLDYVRSQNWREVKVVQGKLCLADMARRTIPQHSIIHELSAPNEIAWAFLVSQYGSVVKVETTAELQDTNRGLMRDGKASGSRAYFLADARELVFGQKARERQLQAVTQDLDAAEKQAGEARDAEARLKVLQREVAGLKQATFDASSLVGLADELESAQRSLAALDLTELADMDKRVKQLRDEISDLESQNITDERANAVADEEIKAARRAVQELTARRDAALAAVQAQTHRLGELARLNPAVSFTELHRRVEDKLQGPHMTTAAAREAAIELSKVPELLMSQSREALSAFNQFCRIDERFVDALPFTALNAPFDDSYVKILALSAGASERVASLRKMGLFNNQIELEAATKSFNDVFTKHFCVEIKSRVDDGIRMLRQMNNELRNLKFGQDSFSIDWSRWEPQLHDYLEFFDAVTKLTESTEALDLFADNELEPKHVKIRDDLVKLLLDDEQERASKELFRIADYRNYRRYDILNNTESGGQVRLSEWGTGSGGQLETPAYIVRAAVVTNRLKMFDKGPSLKLLVNDEAFSRMDEPRARAVLSFMRDNLNLQIISAMPTMKAGAVKDEFNREFSFTRLKPVVNGELDFSIDCADNVFKTDKMRELWERQRLVARERAKQLFDLAEPPVKCAAVVVETAPAK